MLKQSLPTPRAAHLRTAGRTCTRAAVTRRPGVVSGWPDAVDDRLTRADGAWIVDVPGDVLRYSSRSALFCDAAYNVAQLIDLGVFCAIQEGR